MGKLFYDGVMMRDYPLIMGVLVIGAVLTLLDNLLADISYAMADPRICKGLLLSWVCLNVPLHKSCMTA
jgi:peptide/nickel transport system permease protein